jgi:hypothetical protein
MSLCLIHGHDVVRMPGAGEFSGREFDVCQRCGKTIPAFEDTALHRGPTFHTTLAIREDVPGEGEI